MRTADLGIVDAVENGVAFETGISPFYPGSEGVAFLALNGFTGTMAVEISEDGTTYTEVEEVVGVGASDRLVMVDIPDLQNYVRIVCSVRTAGQVEGKLLA